MIDIPEISKTYRDGLYYYDKDWLVLDNPEEYINEVMKCIAYCKPDMYFNHLYRFIIRYDFEEISNSIPNKGRLEELYIEAALKILKERCFIMLSEDETNYSLEWRIPHINYSKYIEGYKDTILNYVNYKLELYPIIGLKETDNAYLHTKSAMFVQHVMFASFLIAFNRIRDEKDSSSYLGAEIVPLGNRNVLNIYLTPSGMINLLSIQKLNKDEMLANFNSFIHEIGLNRINDKDRLTALNTAVILEKEGKTYYHFKPPLYDYANNFIMEKLQRPHISSIKIETQASYEQQT